MKPHVLFIIGPSGSGWAVHLNEQTLGTFEGRPEAVQAAVAVAESTRWFGRTSAVVSEESGELLPIWEVGRAACSKFM
jgi:hypothetical protein